MADDGNFEKGQRADLGLHDDPEGQVAIGSDGSQLAFLTKDPSVHKLYGCCDNTAVMIVDIATGKSQIKSIKRTDPVEGAKCGVWGCGFLEIGQLGPKGSTTVTGWVEPLIPPPPHPGTVAKRDPDDFGMSLATFDVATGDAKAVRPFALHQANASAPQLSGGGTTDFSDDAIWFACNPHSNDINTEAVCSAPTAESTTPAEQDFKSIEFKNKAFTITSVTYSRALKAPVAIAQNIANDANMTATHVYVADGADFGKEVLVDLGTSVGGLHQATISSDGQFLMVYLAAGLGDFPKEFLLTVDLVNKKVVKKIAVKDYGVAGIAVLSPVAC